MSQPIVKHRKYKCKRCGHIKEIQTNHEGECYSWGHYNTCPACPPFAKYPEYGGSTVWVCIEQTKEGWKPEPWKQVTVTIKKGVDQ